MEYDGFTPYPNVGERSNIAVYESRHFPLPYLLENF